MGAFSARNGNSRITDFNKSSLIESPETAAACRPWIRHAQHRGLDRMSQLSASRHRREPDQADKPPTIFHLRPEDASGAARSTLLEGSALYRGRLNSRPVGSSSTAISCMDVAFKAVGVGSVGTISKSCRAVPQRADGEPPLPPSQAGAALRARRDSRRSFFALPRPAAAGKAAWTSRRQRMMQAASDIFSAGRRTGLEDRVLCSHPEEPPSSARSASSPSSRRSRNMPGSAAGRWRALMPARATRPTSPATWEGNEAFDDALASFAMRLRGADGQGLRRAGEG